MHTKEARAMNSDVFAGKWKQVQGSMKEWWGQLTDDDLAKIEGNREKLLGAIQERYGYTKEKAEAEIKRRFPE
jgi:uncharacterized protein YjbJ (UPF0337 family)